MITFDYTCPNCGFIFTFLQPSWKPEHGPTKCPKCKTKKKPTRMISRVRTKSFYGPQDPRHRRGLSRNTLPVNYPVYSKEDL